MTAAAHSGRISFDKPHQPVLSSSRIWLEDTTMTSVDIVSVLLYVMYLVLLWIIIKLLSQKEYAAAHSYLFDHAFIPIVTLLAVGTPLGVLYLLISIHGAGRNIAAIAAIAAFGITLILTHCLIRLYFPVRTTRDNTWEELLGSDDVHSH